MIAESNRRLQRMLYQHALAMVHQRAQEIAYQRVRWEIESSVSGKRFIVISSCHQAVSKVICKSTGILP